MIVYIKTLYGPIAFERQDQPRANQLVREAVEYQRLDIIKEIIKNKLYISKDAIGDAFAENERQRYLPLTKYVEIKDLLGKIKIVRFAKLYKTHPKACRFLRRLCFWGHY